MFSRLFKKPQVNESDSTNVMHAEQALQTRVNRMMRQNLKVDWTPPPMNPTLSFGQKIAAATRGKQ